MFIWFRHVMYHVPLRQRGFIYVCVCVPLSPLPSTRSASSLTTKWRNKSKQCLYGPSPQLCLCIHSYSLILDSTYISLSLYLSIWPMQIFMYITVYLLSYMQVDMCVCASAIHYLFVQVIQRMLSACSMNGTGDVELSVLGVIALEDLLKALLLSSVQVFFRRFVHKWWQ